MTTWTFDDENIYHIQGQLLQEIRTELLRMNATLHSMNSVLTCHNTTAIPALLRGIKRNTTKRKYRKKVTE